MERGYYDLSHFSFAAGKMGRLVTLMLMPVIAGDSVELNLEGVFRLSPLRRNLTVDAMCDLFAFYVPHRHVYGQDWIDFIQQGEDETITFGGVNIGAGQYECLGAPELTGTIPTWILAGYNQIWNRYFRVPSDTASILADTALLSTANDQKWGRLCARPKSLWTTGVETTTTAADREVDVVANKLDITDLDKIKGRYQSEQMRDWFGQRYNDLLKAVWGSGVNVDADERPTLIMRKTSFLSGYDVDGTADASLGQYSGKAAAIGSISFPRRFIPEHGAIWVMALMRFPTIHEQEIHYLFKKSEPTYKEISGDADLWQREPPHELQFQDLFVNSALSDPLGYFPFGQWYRYQPSYVHKIYDNLQGFTFLSNNPTTKNQAWYHRDAEYDTDFQSVQLGDWQSQARVDVGVMRPTSGPLKSIFAGVT